MAPASSERELPSRLGAFAIAGVLGEGGSGIVYDASWGHRRVALKVLRDALLATPRERERFLAEAALLQTIEHPGVVKVLGTGTLPDGRPYLAMEHLDGDSLARRIARGPLALAEALELFDQLADAVAALHARGLVHRDIKPENILLTNGHAVLLDFGIAKAETAVASTTTQEGSVRGTPAYMAPERFFGTPASITTDVYELAVVLYVMLAARLPWANVADPSSRLNPPRPSELGVRVPAALETVLIAALSSRAEARPQTATELSERVRGAAIAESIPPRVTAQLAQQPPQAFAETVSATARPHKRRYAIGAAAVALAGAAGWLATHRSRAHAPADPHDPWAANDAQASASTLPSPAPIDARPRELLAKPVAVPSALAAQLDLHPADADVAFAVSGAKLRASAAMQLAANPSPELAQLDRKCGFDLLAKIDELVVTGTVDGLRLVWQASARGHFTAEAADRCIAALLADQPIVISHPDVNTVYISTRDGDRVDGPRDPSLRRAPIAKLLGDTGADSALWLIGAPPGAAGELLPGVAQPRSLFVTGSIDKVIEVHGGFRFDDAANAQLAAKALKTKLDELATDPIAHGMLGDRRVGAAGNDATFAITIPEAFAAITLQSLFKYLAQ